MFSFRNVIFYIKQPTMAAPMVLATAHLLEIFPKPQDHTSASPTTPPWSLHENGLVWKSPPTAMRTQRCFQAHPQKSYRNGIKCPTNTWYQFSDALSCLVIFVLSKNQIFNKRCQVAEGMIHFKSEALGTSVQRRIPTRKWWMTALH